MCIPLGFKHKAVHIGDLFTVPQQNKPMSKATFLKVWEPHANSRKAYICSYPQTLKYVCLSPVSNQYNTFSCVSLSLFFNGACFIYASD